MDRFNKLYEKQGFLDKYNGSVFTMIFIITVFFVIFSYFYVKRHIGKIRANWAKDRCSPVVMPFAGFINAPKGKSKFDFTAENFNYCLADIVKESVHLALQPFEAVVNIIHKVFSGLGEAINDIRKMFDVIRDGVEDVSRSIMQRILLVLIPFQKLIIKVKDTMAKSQATMTAGMFTAFGAFYTLVSVLNLIYSLIMDILAWMTGMIVVFFATLDFAMAATYTAVYTAVAVPTGMIASAIHEIMGMTGLSHCFKKDTLIRGADGTLYTIENLPLGTQLRRGGKVTAIFKLSAKNQTMYHLGNVVVSGTHQVKYNDDWIFVQNHPHAIEIPENEFEDEFIYCLNTTNKIVNIGDYTFLDWDEITDEVLTKLNCDKRQDVYIKHENGFHPKTIIESRNYGFIAMKDLEVGDVLKHGERITGVVKILPNKELYDYGIFKGTYNLTNIQNLGEIKNKGLCENLDDDYNKPECFCHILTDKGHFYIQDTKLDDYNKSIDFYL